MSSKWQGSAHITGRAEEMGVTRSRASGEGRHKSKRLTRPALALWMAALAFVAMLVLLLGACSSARVSSSSTSAGPVVVIAAENFWGSIAAQLAGGRAGVTSIITNPNTDPHDYEPTAQDALKIATAQLVIENGIGYDPWVDRLLGASSVKGRLVLNVADVVGVKPGGNPHRWYSPGDVQKVIARITADYKALDPKDGAYFNQQEQSFETKSLAPYDALISAIKATYAGTSIGASESIVVPLAQALGLNLVTPASFLNAISEGTDPTAQDKATIDHEIKGKLIKVYIYNSQNATPDVQAQVTEARAAGIPVVTITETLAPATATFQDWQVAQLGRIQAALSRSTGK